MEQDHNSPLCKIDYPCHPPFSKPWQNYWRFNCLYLFFMILIFYILNIKYDIRNIRIVFFFINCSLLVSFNFSTIK
jgi:hypothetical protein